MEDTSFAEAVYFLRGILMESSMVTFVFKQHYSDVVLIMC